MSKLEAVRQKLAAMRSEQDAAVEAAVAEYQRLVVAVAGGVDVPTDDVVAVYEAAGKTFQQFEKDVEQVEQANRWRATMAAEPELQEQLAAVKAKGDEFMQRRAQVEAELRREGVAIADEQRAIEARLQDVFTARREFTAWECKQSDAFKRLAEPVPVGGFRTTLTHHDFATTAPARR